MRNYSADGKGVGSAGCKTLPYGVSLRWLDRVRFHTAPTRRFWSDEIASGEIQHCNYSADGKEIGSVGCKTPPYNGSLRWFEFCSLDSARCYMVICNAVFFCDAIVFGNRRRHGFLRFVMNTAKWLSSYDWYNIARCENLKSQWLRKEKLWIKN